MDSEDESDESETERRTAARRRASAAATLATNAAPAPAPTIVLDDVLQLPTRWNKDDRNASLSVSPDGREIHFIGTLHTLVANRIKS